MRYDAAIIGAGPDGLAAAVRLARGGLKTIVIAHETVAGERCTTREFHPGFRASPFVDELAPIPVGIFWSLGLAQQGAIFAPLPRQAFVQGGEIAVADEAVLAAMHERAQSRVGRELDRCNDEANRVPALRRWFHLAKPPRGAALDGWSRRSLVEALRDTAPTESAALMASALAGRAADPFLRGTALHLLAPGLGHGGMVAGGLATLGEAFAVRAREAGVEISTGLEATGIRLLNDRVAAVTLADGTEIEAAAVLSTLDLKRTILSLFSWSELAKPVVKRAANFRAQGSTARLLVALAEMPSMPGGETALARAVFHTTHAPEEFAAAYAAWRSGVVPEAPPTSIRIVSATDPRLAPPSKATVTVTLGCIPGRLFDGGWTEARREALRATALGALEQVLPGSAEHVLGSQLIVPPDIEAALGATDGDLAGGEIAADQMFANRAWAEWPRTPIAGLYLGGPSSAVGPVATAAAGWIAAKALIADHRAGRLS